MLPLRRPSSHHGKETKSRLGARLWRRLVGNGSSRAALARVCLLAGFLLVCGSIGASLSARPKSSGCQTASFHEATGTKTSRYHGPSVEFKDRFTLIVNTYLRHELLVHSLAHYSKCSQIDAIRVIWVEDGLPPTRVDAPEFYSETKEVRYDVMPTSSLNHRFSPLEGLRTEAVFSIDDDIHAPCTVLTEAFEKWLQNKDTLVGFYPRLHHEDSKCRLSYVQRFSTTFWYGKYSIILTKAAFLHRDYLEMYTHHMSPKIHDLVDERRNCEDIAMQFLVANTSAKAPILVHSSRILDLGQGAFKVKGISSNGGHMKSRTQCLNILREIYQGLPLRTRPLREHKKGWLLRWAPFLDYFSTSWSGRL